MTAPLFRAYVVTLTDGRTVRGSVREDTADDIGLEAWLRARQPGTVSTWHSERAYAATCSVSDLQRAVDRDRLTLPEPAAYNIVRFYQSAGIRRRIIRERVTLTEAQAHCSDPETSSSTCKGSWARRRTRLYGAWFDGYEAR